MNFLTLGDFLGNVVAAQQAAMSGQMSFNDALQAQNLAMMQQCEQEAKNRREQLDALVNEMGKFASKHRMGTIPRKEMPQVDASDLKGLPTGKLEFISPKKLKSMQTTTNTTKVKSMANDWDNAGKKPVLISLDNWILDGHHRVEAARSKGKLVRCIRILLPGRKALSKLQEH